MEIKSQICTTREQSERLIALGLKKETADMAITKHGKDGNGESVLYVAYIPLQHDIPAWSLHRLIMMIPNIVPFGLHQGYFCLHQHKVFYSDYKTVFEFFDVYTNVYDNIIQCIEWLIEKKYFNKEYLEGKENENNFSKS